MIRPKTCFPALGVVRDAETNVISAFGIFDGLTSAGFPLFVQNLSFFVLWQRDPVDPQRAPVTFTASMDADQLTTHRMDIDFAEHLINRYVVKLNGFVIPRPGSLRFRAEPEGGTPAEYSVDVKAAPPEVRAQPQS